MITTINEAQQKLCPTRSVGTLEGYSSSAPTKPIKHQCVADACMSWRWLPADNGEKFVEAIKRHRGENCSSLQEAKAFVENHPEYVRRGAPDRGFCGLSVRPEVRS